jgi:hypothetical protein
MGSETCVSEIVFSYKGSALISRAKNENMTEYMFIVKF